MTSVSRKCRTGGLGGGVAVGVLGYLSVASGPAGSPSRHL